MVHTYSNEGIFFDAIPPLIRNLPGFQKPFKQLAALFFPSAVVTLN